MTQTDIELDLGAETIHCTAEEVATVLAGVLREMRTAAPFITDDDREILRLIMSHPSNALTVGDVFPDFDRNTHFDALASLRRLRTAQFIRPASIDRWEAGERIEIKPFARLVWDRLGETAIFGAAEEDAVVTGDETPVGSENLDLSQPGVNAPGAEEPVRTNENRAGWDEADVLEFLNDDTPPTLKGEVA